jgi:acyl-CoA thioesterase-1
MNNIKAELKKDWPKNRAIHLVFHGHSVPSGYFKTPVINTFDSYPFLALKKLKDIYPNALINMIITAKGGENSVDGEKRFEKEVLIHKPDVLFIDYALNDRDIGIEKSMDAMTKMVEKALATNVQVVLFTPTPHEDYSLLDDSNPYQPFAREIRLLATKHGLGLVDSYDVFKKKQSEEHSISKYMSQVNHPNKEGHQLVANEIIKLFE